MQHPRPGVWCEARPPQTMPCALRGCTGTSGKRCGSAMTPQLPQLASQCPCPWPPAPYQALPPRCSRRDAASLGACFSLRQAAARAMTQHAHGADHEAAPMAAGALVAQPVDIMSQAAQLQAAEAIRLQVRFRADHAQLVGARMHATLRGACAAPGMRTGTGVYGTASTYLTDHQPRLSSYGPNPC